MKNNTTIGAMYRPIAEILADFKQPVNSNLISLKPVFKHGKRTDEVSFIHWYDLVTELDRICPGWSWEVRVQFIPDRCAIEGRLTLRAAEGEFFMESTGVETLDCKGFGDPVYSAEASALRRAMAKFGYGLDLWRKDGDKTPNKAVKYESDQYIQKVKPTVNSPRTKATEKQLARLHAIASKESGLGKEDIKAIIKEVAGYESCEDISQADYDPIVEKIQDAKRFATIAQRKELHQWTKNKNIPADSVKSTLVRLGYDYSKFILRDGLESVKKVILEDWESSKGSRS